MNSMAEARLCVGSPTKPSQAGLVRGGLSGMSGMFARNTTYSCVTQCEYQRIVEKGLFSVQESEFGQVD